MKNHLKLMLFATFAIPLSMNAEGCAQKIFNLVFLRKYESPAYKEFKNNFQNNSGCFFNGQVREDSFNNYHTLLNNDNNNEIEVILNNNRSVKFKRSHYEQAVRLQNENFDNYSNVAALSAVWANRMAVIAAISSVIAGVCAVKNGESIKEAKYIIPTIITTAGLAATGFACNQYDKYHINNLDKAIKEVENGFF